VYMVMVKKNKLKQKSVKGFELRARTLSSPDFLERSISCSRLCSSCRPSFLIW
jgi:hypothetical protein